MATDPTDFATCVLSRLTELERQNRNLRRLVVALLIPTLIFLVLMGVQLVRVGGNPFASERTIEAERFILRDHEGQMRAELKADDISGLSLYSRHGKLRASLIESIGGTAALALYDEEKDLDRVGVFASKEGVYLHFRDRGVKKRIELVLEGDKPGLRFYDENEGLIFSRP